MAKRLFDILCALTGLLFLSPVLFCIALWIKLDSKGPVFFRQIRVGKNGKNFQVFKLRTMVVDADKKGLRITVSKDPRITRSGLFLRKYKLDELPQLFNVLLGNMSLVGPRPEVPEYINEYPYDIKKKVLSVKPGITDFASIEFRDENDLLEGSNDPKHTYINKILPIKQKYYLKYVDEQSVWLDIKLIFRTVWVIVR